MWNFEKCGYDAGLLYGASPELRDRIQSEADWQNWQWRESLQTRFLSLRCFRDVAIAGFSPTTVMDPNASPRMQELAEGLADIFLNGVLSKISGLCRLPNVALPRRPYALGDNVIDTPVVLWSGRSQFSCNSSPFAPAVTSSTLLGYP